MGGIAVITGAGSGIGRVTAEAFLAAGWQVALIGRRAKALEKTAAGHTAASVYPCDVTDETIVGEVFCKIAGDHGRIDTLFNNAGTNIGGALIDEISLDDWRHIIEVNLTGSFIAARAAFAQMRAQDPVGGRIINSGSISAYVPRPGSAPYTASKHAITGLTRTIALDGRPYNIACGQIDIGNALTDMAQAMTKGVPQADLSVKEEAVMDVTHVAQAVVNMAELPPSANILFQTIMATTMPFVGRG